MENPDPGFVSRFDSPETVLARERMVRHQISERGIRDRRILDALLKIPRHHFLPEEYREHSYEDKAVPIGGGQTISQPYIVAYLASQLDIRKSDSVLEIGTGSGYLTAVLDLLGAKILSLEILPDLYHAAVTRLEEWSPGFTERNRVECGDAILILKEKKTFSRIVSSACFPKEPEEGGFVSSLLEEGGIAALPVEAEKGQQYLLTLEKKHGLLRENKRLSVKFVPLVGRTDLL
ncbi:protein-L-isoaspartate O-methyltransferase [Leptospira wolffii]|uniref:Protein-L-isoaspartate O-methyltransferase n=1 Tax=Leptospira wolffii TaxID=409998 RepID=A0ABV5BTE3_9LEPT|nr:protein-L-isoaspartate O-methyltransferase [Leptospira wolffii]EPG66367.1 putative protein-L-isoaspartate O-methyltransferase [Leptospira wolffii serovar Khorat str. Khorat-H2]TGL44074.1 protein-L-isoaspartate O-methyltransferase [Leptospira wolffii]